MKKYLAIFLCAALLILPACTEKYDVLGQSSQEEFSTSDVPAEAPVGGIVPGVNADNYPEVFSSTANIPLMAKLYSEVCGVSLEDAQQQVDTSATTSEAWQKMNSDEVDRLLLVYEAPQSVKTQIEDASVKLQVDPIGRDGLVFLVNAKNSVENITQQQLIDIYTGKITDWSQVGGNAGPIVPFQRNEDSGSQTMFLKLLMRDITPMQPPTELVPAMMGTLIDGVASYDGSGSAIGYSVYYYASLMYANPDIKLLQVDGITPDNATIGSGQYPLVNDFYAVIRESTPQDHPARLLHDYLLSDAGKILITDAGYVPVP